MFETNEPTLEELLRDVSTGKIQLPDFQRQWVWDDVHIRELIASVAKSFPIGAVMLLSTEGDGVRFKPRPVEGVRLTQKKHPKLLILDGQQRLTSLYLAMVDQEPVRTQNDKKQALKRYYYLDIEKALLGDDMIDAIIGVPDDRMVKSDFARKVDLDLSKPEYEYEHGYFPVNILFNGELRLKWRNGYNAYFKYDPDKMRVMDAFESTIWLPLQKYKLPVIELLEDTTKDAVCKVFEKVNTGGVPLTVFELLTATFAADDFELRKDWEQRRHGPRAGGCLDESPVLKDFDSTDFLTAITLLTSYTDHEAGSSKSVSCKRKDVLDLKLHDYRKYSDSISEGLVKVARFLSREKVFDSRDLPYKTQLIPLSVICAVLGDRFESDPIHRKLARWYWSGVFGELYGGANETRYALDVPDVLDWIAGGNEPRTVSAASFSPTRLVTLQSRLSAAYKGLMARPMQTVSNDFISGEPIEVHTFFDQAVDIHHIFPRAYCEKAGIDSRRCDSVINKAPLSSRTNKKLSGHAPSVYVESIERNEQIDPEHLDAHQATHQIGPALLRQDDFDSFFRDRARKLLDIIESAMGKTVSGRDSDETVEAFGGPLNMGFL